MHPAPSIHVDLIDTISRASWKSNARKAVELVEHLRPLGWELTHDDDSETIYVNKVPSIAEVRRLKNED